ncbi:unnamed protein product, partial [Sphenostylis stenocarpa]
IVGYLIRRKYDCETSRRRSMSNRIIHEMANLRNQIPPPSWTFSPCSSSSSPLSEWTFQAEQYFGLTQTTLVQKWPCCPSLCRGVH